MNKIRILIVEDEAIVALDIRRQLAELGYEPAAHTMRGEDAVELAEQLRPDLVLMDIQLPGEMDGIATAQEIRERFSIPVVFLTAFAGGETLKRARLAEPYGYIIKPFEDRELRTVIEMALYKHHAERELRESHAVLKAVIHGAMDGFYFIDPQGHFLDVNEAYCQMTGHSREELLQMSLCDLAVDETLEDITRRLAEGVQNGFKRFERRLRCKDGRVIYVEVSPSFIRGERPQIFGFARDITEKKRAGEATRYAASLLEAALEATADGLLISDNDGRMTHYNRKFVELWEIPQAILEQRNENAAVAFVLDQVKEPAAFKMRIEELYAHPEEDGFDVLELKGGRTLERYSRAHQMDGRVVGRVLSFREVTERKRLEDQLRQAQKMEAIGQLAGGVAHDFNNILAAILMHLGLLEEETGLSDSIRTALKEMTGEAQRAAALTRQLLAFSRRQVIQIKPVDLDALVRNLFKMLRRLLGESVTLDWNCSSPMPALNADPGMIEQIIVNLCVNARDAMPHGGSILIKALFVRIEENAAGNHPENRSGDFIRLSVIDTGCGMEEGVLKHIFEPFFTTKDVGRGTGLGLSTVYGIIKQHRGWIEVESVVGQGSAFHVFLPAIAQVRDGEQIVRTMPRLEGRGETILVVEDELAVRMLICITLERRGYRVLKASSGPEAMGLWNQYRADIDLLLSDVVMPKGMTGYEVAEAMRKDKPGLKVILSTGYSEKLSELDRQGEQPYFVLTKPYVPDALLGAIRRLIEQE